MDERTFVELGVKLTEVATRNGAALITDRIRTAKAKKESKEIINELEEIISDLLSDKAEIQRIAQAYEQELVSQKITEEDIRYITDNLLPLFTEFIPDKDKKQIEQLKKILSIETLTIMQLIGFNYKHAIGEPLTLLCRKYIESNIPMDSKINVDYTMAMATLAKDKEATKRFYNLLGREMPEENNSDEI